MIDQLMVGKFLPHMAIVKMILCYQHSCLQMHQYKMIDQCLVGKFLPHMVFVKMILCYQHSNLQMSQYKQKNWLIRN